MTSEPESVPAAGIRLEVFLLGALMGTFLLVALPHAEAAVRQWSTGQPASTGWIGYYATHLWVTVWLVTCLVYGAPHLASRIRWLRKSRRFARGQLTEYGSGIYGAVALASFIALEYRRILAQWWPDDGISVRWVVSNLFDFGIDTFMNGIWAAVWPAFHGKAFPEFGRQFWAAFGVAAAIYYAGRAAMAALPRDAVPTADTPAPRRV